MVPAATNPVSFATAFENNRDDAQPLDMGMLCIGARFGIDLEKQ